jgi:hypothetical protein
MLYKMSDTDFSDDDEQDDTKNERFNKFFNGNKDFTPFNKEYKNPLNLISDIRTLTEAIENDYQDQEMLHQVEDWLLATFVYHISKGTYDSNMIKKISTFFVQIPDYEKWYA